MNKCIFTVLILSLLPAGLAFSYEKALQEQVRQGNWRDAERTLSRAGQICRQTTDYENCLAKVHFSRAWTYTRLAAQGEAKKEVYLGRARDSYLTILKKHPDHLPTIDNLVLVLQQLGEPRQLERVLHSLRRLGDTKRVNKTLMMLASLYDEAGDRRRAFDCYVQAYEFAPSQQPLNGLLSVYNQSPDQAKVAQMLVLADKSENVSMSRRLHEAILTTRNIATPAQWEKAAIEWVALLGKERLFTADLIERDLDSKMNPEFAELEHRLREPYLGLSRNEATITDRTLLESQQEGWWTDNLVRAWAFSIAAWSEGHNRLLSGDVEGTNAIWSAALQFAPPSYTYSSRELDGRWAVSLELLTDLARIQLIYKGRIDRTGARFASIEETLFSSKLQAYQFNDLVAIQRHHTLMGKMYADLGIFSEKKTGARSAEFQLKHAIKTSKRRSRQTGKADPQPQLVKLMADGYSCMLPSQNSRCVSKPDRAQNLYLQATKDYLKLDAALPATRTLENIKVTTPRLQNEVKELETLIDLRTDLTTEYLTKGKSHPDVVNKQIDIANQWRLLGETSKAQESIDRVMVDKKQVFDKTRMYQQLNSGEIENLKKQAVQLQKIESDAVK